MPWLINTEVDRQRFGGQRFGGGRIHVRFKAGPKDGFRDDVLPRPLDAKQAIFQNVMRPALRLMNAVEQIGPFEGRESPVSIYFPMHAVHAHCAGYKIPKWKVPPEIMEEMRYFLNDRKPVVITLRECSYWPTRNSNMEAWTGFAQNCGEDIIFVRDTAKAYEPMPGFETNARAAVELLWRAALMESAKCNLLVANGPVSISLYGHAPWMVFGCLTPEIPEYRAGNADWWKKQMDVEVGQQFPWSGPKQRIIWDKDTRDAIESAWANWKAIP